VTADRSHHQIIDAWAQHPTLRHIADPIFESLRRWTRTDVPAEELPVSLTVGLMDEGGVDRALISAWYGQRGPMISNDEVAGFVAEAPDRLVGDRPHRTAHVIRGGAPHASRPGRPRLS
jgi:hypothetical protein